MSKKGYQFGTIQGVFVPSLLTILGVIMYMRFGWVLGNVGLTGTLIIVSLSTAVTFVTSLSLSTLATNSQVGAGGAYYMISRSLGIEAGAAIGLPLYFAQALSISFYVSGFAESINASFGGMDQQMVSLITLGGIGLLVYISASLALKSQYLILALIVFSLISFFMGGGDLLEKTQVNIPVERASFWVVFAVFFPAVTGITAGLGMSGDLRNPSKSLTLGTLAAVLVSYMIYLAIPLFLDEQIENPDILIQDRMIMTNMARWKWAVLAGLWGATISSAIGSLLGAPRTMQALGKDRVLPRIVARGYGRSNDPRIATALTFVIAISGVMLGDLDVIAPVLSMFFLTTYGLINLSATFESIIGSPWWRPTFKVHWSISFLGALGCFATMIMINPGASIMAVVFSVLVFVITKKRNLKAHWGDARAGIMMWMTQQIVYRLAKRRPDERTWRPNLMVFAGSPSSRWYLIALADALTRGRGMMTTVSIVPKRTPFERIHSIEKAFRSFLKQKQVESLVKVYPAENPVRGGETLIQAYGFGPIEPNTVMLGDPSENNPLDNYSELLYAAIEKGKNIVIVKEGTEVLGSTRKDKKRAYIDAWWNPQSTNAGLLLALAFMMRSSSHWYRARLRVHTIIHNVNEEHNAEERIKATVKKMRIRADVIVHENRHKIPHLDYIARECQDSSFVLLGMKNPDPGETPQEYQSYVEYLSKKTRRLPATALVMAAENVEFEQLFSD